MLLRKRKRRPQVYSDKMMSSEEWQKLRLGEHNSSGIEIPSRATNVKTAQGPVRFALGEKGEARLLLPLHDRERVPELLSTSYLKIGDVECLLEGKNHRFLDFTCLSKDLEGVFAEVAEEILIRIKDGISCPSAAQATLEDFRTLLLTGPKLAVSDNIISGLVGELLILNRLLDRSSGAWSSWNGPLGDRHDFRAKDNSLEIKTSARPDNSQITISSLEQLSAPTGGSLHLTHLILEQVAGGQLSVAKLATAAFEKASNSEELQRRLTSIDCPNPVAPEWNHLSFRFEREATYHVIPGFPRIIAEEFNRGKLPDGVCGAVYQIDLSVADAFRISSEKTEEVEKGLIV